MEHSVGQFKGYGGLNMHYQCWLPDNKPKVILLFVHGFAEHSGRYGNLVDYFLSRGYGLYGYDLRGHGKSAGVRGYADRFSHFVDDLDVFFKLVQGRHPDSKIFLLGHSTGGTIATAYTILHQQTGFEGLILSGAILSPPSDVPAVTIFAARMLSFILPKAGLYAMDAATISQDKSVVKAYLNDPLVYHGKVRARLGIELMNAMDIILRRIPEIRLPLLIMHGAADRLSNPRGSEILYREASSADKTLKLYPGYYHEILNEPGRQQVLADIEAWLNAHI